MNKKTIVFAGPTLSGLLTLQEELSQEFVFHAPIKCGDLLEARKENYKTAVIIDGLFETVPAIWHKEILDFVDKEGVVIGCSSMGALRAVECKPFGMLGYGKIYEDFCLGRISDDDEVTIAHLGKAHGYLPLSDAMVNIRYTVADAVLKGALDPSDSDRIIKMTKSIFYRKRSLRNFVESELKNSNSLASFQEYLNSMGIIDQKKLDATQLLKEFSSVLQHARNEISNRSDEPFRESGTIRKLKFVRSTSAPVLESQALSPEARITKMTRLFFGKTYFMLQDLAVAMMCFNITADFQEAKTSSKKPVTVSWLKESWLEGETCSNLFHSALQECPEYYDLTEIPMTVRVLAFIYDIPIQTFDRADSFSDDSVLSLESDSRSLRLLYLIGLFLDARMKQDVLAQMFRPTHKAIEQRIAEYEKMTKESETESNEYLRKFGLTDLAEAANAAEVLSHLIHPPSGTIAFPIFADVYDWFTLACQTTGFSEQLKLLLQPIVRKSFSLELYFRLVLLSPQSRAFALRSSGLPAHLLGRDSIINYINAELSIKV